MQISVQIGLNWNWPTGTELGNISLTNFNSTNLQLLDTRSNSKCLRLTYNVGCLEGVKTVSMGCPKYVWGE